MQPIPLFLSDVSIVRFAVVQCLLVRYRSRTTTTSETTSAALKIETKNHMNVCLYKISTQI